MPDSPDPAPETAPDPLGYIVITCNQASRLPSLECDYFYGNLAEAIEARDDMRTETMRVGRGERHAVAAVFEMEEDGEAADGYRAINLEGATMAADPYDPLPDLIGYAVASRRSRTKHAAFLHGRIMDKLGITDQMDADEAEGLLRRAVERAREDGSDGG